MSSVAFLGHKNAPKSLAAGTLRQTRIREHIYSTSSQTDPLAVFKWSTSKAPTCKGWEERRKGKAPKWSMPPVARTPRAAADICTTSCVIGPIASAKGLRRITDRQTETETHQFIYHQLSITQVVIKATIWYKNNNEWTRKYRLHNQNHNNIECVIRNGCNE